MCVWDGDNAGDSLGTNRGGGMRLREGFCVRRRWAKWQRTGAKALQRPPILVRPFCAYPPLPTPHRRTTAASQDYRTPDCRRCHPLRVRNRPHAAPDPADLARPSLATLTKPYPLHLTPDGDETRDVDDLNQGGTGTIQHHTTAALHFPYRVTLRSFAPALR